MSPKGDYYKILEVSRKASESDIKKSYYKLAKQWHPDKNSTPGAEERFKEISKAYEILSDTNKRQLYDLQTNLDDVKPSASTTKTHSNHQYTYYKSEASGSHTRTETNNDSSSYNNRWSSYYENYPSRDSSGYYKSSSNNKSKHHSHHNHSTGNTNDYYGYHQHQYDSYYQPYFDYDSNDNMYDDDTPAPPPQSNQRHNSKKSKSSKSKSKSSNKSRPRWNNNWAFETSNDTGQTDDDAAYNDDPNFGFVFHPSDPYEVFEAFAMYKMFKDMTNQMFTDMSNDELLLHLATIISAFNVSSTSSTTTTPQPPSTSANNRRKSNNNYNENSSSSFTKPSSSKTSSTTKLPKMTNLNSKNSTTTTKSSKKNGKNDDSWEFEWLGEDANGKKRNRKTTDSPNLPPFVRTDSDDEYDYEIFYDDTDDSIYDQIYLKCAYCSKVLSDEDSLNKHETICKKLSHNTAKQTQHKEYTPSSPLVMTKCPICKAKMSTYEYLIHNCMANTTTSTSANNNSTNNKPKFSESTPNFTSSTNTDKKSADNLYDTTKQASFTNTPAPDQTYPPYKQPKYSSTEFTGKKTTTPRHQSSKPTSTSTTSKSESTSQSHSTNTQSTDSKTDEDISAGGGFGTTTTSQQQQQKRTNVSQQTPKKPDPTTTTKQSQTKSNDPYKKPHTSHGTFTGLKREKLKSGVQIK